MMADPTASKDAAPFVETELGRLVVEQGLATRDDVDRCLAEAIESGSAPSPRSLGRVLVDRRVVTPGQIARVRKALEAPAGQIPGYRVLHRVGAGSMATVFKALQISLDRVVAIKVLSRRLSASAEYVDRFYREGRAAAKLNHPNIVQAIDVGEANGYHYFVMEYVEGHSLHDELAAGKVFAEASALHVVIQVARALEHAHQQGFIHRDVKPKNIMIAAAGTAKLADMGLARAASDYQAARAEAGKAFGTPFYIAPEQIRGEVDLDFRCDIYSLGATLYHLVTGRVPFAAPTPVGVMQRHLDEPLVPPDHVNERLSAGIGEVVEQMMAKERRRRYASTSDLLLDLEAVAAGGAPLQVRQRVDDGVLSGLAGGADAGQTPPRPTGPTHLLVYLVLLVAALACSAILNVVLLLRR